MYEVTITVYETLVFMADSDSDSDVVVGAKCQPDLSHAAAV